MFHFHEWDLAQIIHRDRGVAMPEQRETPITRDLHDGTSDT